MDLMLRLLSDLCSLAVAAFSIYSPVCLPTLTVTLPSTSLVNRWPSARWVRPFSARGSRCLLTDTRESRDRAGALYSQNTNDNNDDRARTEASWISPVAAAVSALLPNSVTTENYSNCATLKCSIISAIGIISGRYRSVCVKNTTTAAVY